MKCSGSREILLAHIHSSHDAATKKQTGIFRHCAKLEKEVGGTGGRKLVLEIPQSFTIIKNNKTKTEADAVQSGLTSTLKMEDEVMSATMKTLASLTSDNAAISVSKMLREMAAEEWKNDLE